MLDAPQLTPMMAAGSQPRQGDLGICGICRPASASEDFVRCSDARPVAAG